MANVTGGVLATSVTECGGLGVIGGGYCHPEWLKRELGLAKDNTFGVGFITWRLAQNPSILDMALERNPRAIWLSFGDIQPFVEKIKNHNIPLICQVQTVRQAKECKEKGANIIVAQGTEAGGHGGDRGSMALIPAVVDAVFPLPVLAAGGISDARGIAASMMLGAQGAVMGTRFLASEESLASNPAKMSVVRSSGDDTIRSNILDYARGYDWPRPYTGRTIVNGFIQKWNKKDIQCEEDKVTLKQDYEGESHDDPVVFAGEGIDMIHNVLPTKIIMDQIITDLQRFNLPNS